MVFSGERYYHTLKKIVVFRAGVSVAKMCLDQPQTFQKVDTNQVFPLEH